nr:MAG TPA: hypothetical protein [Bacteriophage sp.]
MINCQLVIQELLEILFTNRPSRIFNCAIIIKMSLAGK